MSKELFKISGSHIAMMSFILEGILAATYFFWYYYNGQLEFVAPSFRDFWLGAVFCLPLIFVNYSIFGPNSHNSDLLSSCYEFKDKIVRPIAESTDYKSSLVIAICAGIGEELFFRGLIQPQLGVIVASLLFSILHFGPSVTKYYFIAMLYFFIGIYFGLLYKFFTTLWVPIFVHIIYDYLALLYMRYVYQSPVLLNKVTSGEVTSVKPVS
ncbi:MAG: CPBP family intramembrane metalloprotease [Proteobacteria bacterium]|nr:CPBP family intramembrane metalloprotease [Pseudomonadota bacterium]